MKTCYYTIVLLLFAVASHGQEHTVFGKITDEKAMPLAGATIQINDGEGTVSDESGLYQIELRKSQLADTISLTIRHLGFEVFDTTLIVQERDLIVSKSLQPSFSNLPDIEITSKLDKTIFEKEIAIIDYTVVHNKLVTLSWAKSKRIVRMYSLTGHLLHTIDIAEQFNSFHESYTGRIHIVGDQTCVELYTGDKLYLGEEYPIKQFHDVVEKCVFVFNGNYIFKNYTRHNKRALYYIYDEPGVPSILFDVYDEDAAKTASSYFWKIVGRYKSTVTSPSEKNTVYGFGELGHELSEDWDGDLRDLIVSNELQSLVSYYLSVESKKINTAEFIHNDKMVVFDIVNNQLHQFNSELKKDRSIDLPNDLNWNKSDLFQDKTSGEMYALAPNLELYHVDLDGPAVNLELLFKFRGAGIPSKFEINDGILYCLMKNSHNSLATVKRQPIDRYVTNK